MPHTQTIHVYPISVDFRLPSLIFFCSSILTPQNSIFPKADNYMNTNGLTAINEVLF